MAPSVRLRSHSSRSQASAFHQSPDPRHGPAACTTAPREEWLSLAEFELVARHRGYRPRVLKQTYGACYEIYGYDKQGNLVEAYFSPVNAKLVRSNVVTVRPGVPAGDK